ncbi:glycosyltransferase family 61 protein [Lacisediminihabitans sp.]|jgi:capsular polysaccharide biosynthesis protein|uniref:glycosyltransferase family 61 protein n=1 Tax=Lacisediminihabitans sp. TaxID=2787631 RepID=UPI002F92D67B
MSSFTAQTRAYRAFEKSFVDAVRAYALDYDERYLEAAAQLLVSLSTETHDHHVTSPVRTVAIKGWMLSNSGFRISARHLRSLNPGYTIHAKRYLRPEIARRDQRPTPAGFIVNARSSIESPLFDFRARDASGGTHLLPTSNSDAAFQASFYPHLISDGGPESPDQPLGYLDSIRQAPWPIDDDRTTWLGALAHRMPAELFDLIDAPVGEAWRGVVADLLGVFSSEARWSDRFNLAGRGPGSAFHSDLRLVNVDRPSGGAGGALGDGVALPVFDGPNHIHRASPGPVHIDRPSTEWLHLEDALIQDGGTVLVGDSLVLYEEAADPRNDFVAGQWDTVYGSQSHPEAALVRLKEPSEERIAEGILLAGRSDGNWYHWLIEYLPRVLMIEPDLPPDIPLLVTRRTPESGLAALRAITDRPLVSFDPETLQSVGRLHVVAPPVQVLDTTRVPWSEGIRLNPQPLRALRTAWGLTDDPVVGGRRVFLSRRSAHRGLLNEKALVDSAIAHGLEIVEPGTMTFEDQLELFSSASLVVGASGAVMANYLMMSRGSRVIALTSEALTSFVLPAAIAAVAGVGFAYVSGPTSTTLAESGTRNNWMHSDFSIDPTVFSEALSLN